MLKFVTKMFNYVLRYRATISYIVLIVLINALFAIFPTYKILGFNVSLIDVTVGVIYVMRDFAQREIKHYVIIAMLIGSFFSYFLASKDVALASVTSFIIAESVDWGIYTFTKKPLSKRIFWSAAISSPVDSAVFLYMLNMFNVLALFVMMTAKILGVLLVWYIWRLKERHAEQDLVFSAQ